MKGYAIVIEGDAGTNFSGYSPDLPGVVATGDTLEEVERLMREGIAIYLDELRETGEPVPGSDGGPSARGFVARRRVRRWRADTTQRTLPPTLANARRSASVA